MGCHIEAAAARWPDGARQHLDGTLYQVTYTNLQSLSRGAPWETSTSAVDGASADHCTITSQSKTAYIHGVFTPPLLCQPTTNQPTDGALKATSSRAAKPRGPTLTRGSGGGSYGGSRPF